MDRDAGRAAARDRLRDPAGRPVPAPTVADNIATVPKLLGWDSGADPRAASTSCWSSSGSSPRCAERYPAQLCGGQRQRVGVARALAADPPLMLMDEPFGAIDPITRARLQDEFLRLQTEIRKTVVFVTHDIDEAIKMGDRIAILRDGGELAQYATPAELLMHPADEFVEQLRRRRPRAQAPGADARARARAAAAHARASATAAARSPRTRRCATRSSSCSQAGRQEGIVVDASGQRARRDLDRPDLALAGAAGVTCIAAQTVSPTSAAARLLRAREQRLLLGLGPGQLERRRCGRPCASTSRSPRSRSSIGFVDRVRAGAARAPPTRLRGADHGDHRVLYTIPSLALFQILVGFSFLGLNRADGRDRARQLHAADPVPQHARRAARRPAGRARGGRAAWA